MTRGAKWIFAAIVLLLIAGAGYVLLGRGGHDSTLGQTVNASIDDVMAVGGRVMELPLFLLMGATILFAGIVVIGVERLGMGHKLKGVRVVMMTLGVVALMGLAYAANQQNAKLQRDNAHLREQLNAQRGSVADVQPVPVEAVKPAATAATVTTAASPGPVAKIGPTPTVPPTVAVATAPTAVVTATKPAVRDTLLFDRDLASKNLTAVFGRNSLTPKIYDQSADWMTVSIGTPQTIAYLAIIDLTLPGVEIKVGGNMNAKTLTSDFSKITGSSIAINGEAGTAPQANAGLGTWTGHFMTAGKLVQSETPGNPRPFLSFDKNNKATFTAMASKDRKIPADAYNVIWGRLDSLINGDIQTADERGRQPRTAMALNKDASRLFLMVVDGRQQGFSIGFSRAEVGQFLKAFGAYNGMLCDEGGSSLWYTKKFGLMNYPSDGEERATYTHFGIKYTP